LLSNSIILRALFAVAGRDEHLHLRRDAETVVKNIDAALVDERRLSQQAMSFCLHTVGAAL